MTNEQKLLLISRIVDEPHGVNIVRALSDEGDNKYNAMAAADHYVETLAQRIKNVLSNEEE